MLVDPLHPLHDRRQSALLGACDLGYREDDVPRRQFAAEMDEALLGGAGPFGVNPLAGERADWLA